MGYFSYFSFLSLRDCINTHIANTWHGLPSQKGSTLRGVGVLSCVLWKHIVFYLGSPLLSHSFVMNGVLVRSDYRDWSYVLEAKCTGVPELESQHPHPLLSVAQVLGDLVPSSCLCAHCMHMVHSHTCRENTIHHTKIKTNESWK